MSTPQDLFALALDAAGDGKAFVGQGEVSLALAGAELVDLVASGAAELDGDRIVPGPEDAAAGALIREQPYETVEDWLWRRGEGLSAVYAEAWEPEHGSTPPRRWSLRRKTAPDAGADSSAAARRRADERWTSGEPALQGLAAAAGIRTLPSDAATPPADDAVATIVSAVDDAVAELGAVRHRRGIEKAAFDNIWRVP